MKLPEIKRLAENHSAEELEAAAAELEAEHPCSVSVTGDDDGERITHLLCAAEILRASETNGTDVRAEFRAFAARVRDVLSP